MHKRVAALLSHLIELEDVDTWEAWAAAFTHREAVGAEEGADASERDE